MEAVECVEKLISVYDARVPRFIDEDSAKVVREMRREVAELIVAFIEANIREPELFLRVHNHDIRQTLKHVRAEMLYNAAIRVSHPTPKGGA